MAITKKTTAKAKTGSSKAQKLLKAHALRDDLHIPPVNPLPPKEQAKRNKKRARNDRRSRLERMHNSIFAQSMFGRKPVFPGKIVIPSAEDARMPDSARIQDLKPAAQVYWVDGSEAKGFLGAGIVWKADGRFVLGRCHLGQNTGGDNLDAELYALGEALRQAKKCMQQGAELEVVSVFSDALAVLESIKQGNCRTFGPLRSGGTALENLYARAQWLKERNVSIELIWVKGHANSEGNSLADEAAGRATAEQASNLPPPIPYFSIHKTELDVPQVWRDRGQDWIDEWLWRANRAHVKTSKKQLWKHKNEQGREAWNFELESFKARMVDNQADCPTVLGPGPSDYAAVELHNSLDALRQGAVEAFYCNLSQNATDDRMIKLCEIRQRLLDMLAAVATRSTYADVARSVGKALKLDKEIQKFQSRVADKQTRSRRERREEWSQVLRARSRGSVDKQNEKESIASMDNDLDGVDISQFESLSSIGEDIGSRIMEVEAHDEESNSPALEGSWVGDTLLLTLGNNPDCGCARLSDRDPSPPYDCPLVSSLPI